MFVFRSCWRQTGVENPESAGGGTIPRDRRRKRIVKGPSFEGEPGYPELVSFLTLLLPISAEMSNPTRQVSLVCRAQVPHLPGLMILGGGKSPATSTQNLCMDSGLNVGGDGLARTLFGTEENLVESSINSNVVLSPLSNSCGGLFSVCS